MVVRRNRRRLKGLLAAAAVCGAGWCGLLMAGDAAPSRYACKQVSELLSQPRPDLPTIAPRAERPSEDTADVSIPASGRVELPPLPPRPGVADQRIPVSPGLPTVEPRAPAAASEVGRASVALLTHSQVGDEFEAVPLPPRQTAPVSQPRLAPPTGQRTTTTVLDVVVSESGVPLPPRAEHEGWGPGRQPSAPAAAMSITIVEPPAAGDSAGSVASQPYYEAGVFNSDALFSGVPATVNDLAPLSIGSEGGLPTHGGLALEGSLLAPQPLSASTGGPVVLDDYLGNPLPGPTGRRGGDDADAQPLTPERRSQLNNALYDLQKPLRTITMSGHLAGREPPDLASVVEPETEPELLWGAPWPSDPLRWYRYTVPFYHRPLYFEQPNLERCGHTWGVLTPYASAAHFFGNIVLLPVHAVIDLPCVPVKTLGDCPQCHSYGLCPTLNRSRD